MSAILPAALPKRVHCEADDWDFDPRYTEGVCPICGWRAEHAVRPKPAWLVRLQELPWDVVGVAALAVVLLVLAFWVGRAAGIDITPRG